MQIRLATEQDRIAWDSFVERFDTPPLNTFSWKEILEKAYGVSAQFFIAFNEAKVVCGVLPTYTTADYYNRRRLYSLRFGLLADSADSEKRLLEHLDAFCKDNRIVSGLVNSGYKKSESGFPEIVKKTAVLELGGTEEDSWRNLKDKTRNLIRKSARAGLSAEKGFHNLNAFYEIYASCMTGKGVSIVSREFFNCLFEKLRGNTELIVAKKHGKIIGGILVLFSRSRAIYPFQVSLRAFRGCAPNQFLIWEAAKECVSRGIRFLDMGESSRSSETYAFKMNFGGRETNTYYYTTLNENARPALPSFAALISKAYRLLPWPLRKRTGVWLRTKGRII